MSRLGERVVTFLARSSYTIWIGGGVFLAFVAAPAAFSAAEGPETAAAVVGAMLSRWHWISVIAPLGVLLSARFRHKWPLVLIVVAVALANAQWLVDNRIHDLRASVAGSVSELDESDAVRRTFGALHGVSMTLMLGQLLCGAGVLVSTSRSGRQSSVVSSQ